MLQRAGLAKVACMYLTNVGFSRSVGKTVFQAVLWKTIMPAVGFSFCRVSARPFWKPSIAWKLFFRPISSSFFLPQAVVHSACW